VFAGVVSDTSDFSAVIEYHDEQLELTIYIPEVLGSCLILETSYRSIIRGASPD
jgi:hypothetical protein